MTAIGLHGQSVLIIAYTALMTAVSLVNSMMTDVVDEFELP